MQHNSHRVQRPTRDVSLLPRASFTWVYTSQLSSGRHVYWKQIQPKRSLVTWLITLLLIICPSSYKARPDNLIGLVRFGSAIIFPQRSDARPNFHNKNDFWQNQWRIQFTSGKTNKLTTPPAVVANPLITIYRSISQSSLSVSELSGLTVCQLSVFHTHCVCCCWWSCRCISCISFKNKLVHVLK